MNTLAANIAPVLEQQPAALPSAEIAAAIEVREGRLRDLLGVDYDYARSSGLIDLFDYHPETGEDGLIHILAGDLDTGDGAVAIPGGYHHEESGRLWGTVTGENGEERPATRVDRGHMESGNSAHRKKFREHPAEPYIARVAIGDRPKMALSPDGGVVPTNNAMYPKEYDPLAVMQAVRMAYEGADIANGRPSVDDHGRPVIIADGQATLIDGASEMTVRLIINAENKRVETAFPLTNGKAIMGLSEADMMAHATYQTPTSAVRN
ncbi:MAG TPA: hypothetical protein VLF71_05940 [Candidatus Saccharimonadales bacterium]|nr:hypothetical protein [Candidatus Saccharimonadales bacterium]